MEEGDHSNCSVELFSCPEHRADHMRVMGYDPDYMVPTSPDTDEPSPMFRDAEGNRTCGFCLWCNRDFYSIEEWREHTENDMANCEVFQKLKDETTTPPVLQDMFEEAGLSEPDDEGDNEEQ